MNARQRLGFLFEDKVHDLISQSMYQVLREVDVVYKYSVLSSGIDHLIYLPDFIICIQDKWRESKPNLSQINHFIKGVENIHIKENYKKCIGIYLSKEPVTKGGLDAFEFENYKGINYFLSISGYNMDIILNKLAGIFYDNHIYFYEPDGSAIMLDSYNYS
jgi:hypothetical protein